MKNWIQMALVLLAAVGCLHSRETSGQTGQEISHPKLNSVRDKSAESVLKEYCFGCHAGNEPEGGLDLEKWVTEKAYDATLVFENLITGRMPPKDADQPTLAEKKSLLKWLAARQRTHSLESFRRRSRHEFEAAANDLLGIRLPVADLFVKDRGTFDFNSDRKIKLTKESLASYFLASDQLLEFAFPKSGFAPETTWKTNRVKDSHQTYTIYVRDFRDGLLFSWTRANNGNPYSFFYDDFEPVVSGWYELTFDAAKVGEFPEAVSVQVYAGKYYFADDRPQPQRLLGVLSLDDSKVKPQTIQVFLNPGENVSVHCYSKHNWRQKGGDQGAFIRQLTARGPVYENWPPDSYHKVFGDIGLKVPKRKINTVQPSVSHLKEIGGRIRVSSFQVGMEKEKMLDGSNKTFWHTRFKPDVAKPPHYVIIENPTRHAIKGLSYSTWSGGNGNGQVKRYAVAFSEDGEEWSRAAIEGDLEIQVAAAQEILFPKMTTKPFIRFLVKDAVSLDGKSLASIGKLDVLIESNKVNERTRIQVVSDSAKDLQEVLRRLANRAFSSTLTDEELGPYFEVARRSFERDGDFVAATSLGIKAILCSHRFLLTPGEHRNDSFRLAAELARSLWLSVPDERLLHLAKSDSLSAGQAKVEIERMLMDPRSKRMIHSFCSQWLNLRSFDEISPSLKLYPLYDGLLNHFLPLETEAYLQHVIQHDLPISSLIDSDFSILNQRLAQHYGIENVYGQELRKVRLPANSPRGGLLTMGSVLKVTTDGFQTSPILRGAWISRNLVGNTLAPPPANVASIESKPDDAASLKEQVDRHKDQPACYACHKQIDPYGFALESFDATGRYRTQYRVEQPHRGTFQYRPQGYFQLAAKVDSSGAIGELEFEDVIQLKKILLKEDRKVAYNIAKKFFEYATGAQPTLRQRIELFELIPDKSEDRRLKELIAKILIFAFVKEVDE